jgi:hypothetical protein
MTRTTFMVRKTFLALSAVLLTATASQAALLLHVSDPTPLADTSTSTGLVSYTISAVANGGETVNGMSNPSLTAIGQGLGAHQVFTTITNSQTPDRQAQLNGATLWSDSWQPYDSYFFFTTANSLKAGTGSITETKSGTGATLPQGSALGAPNTGFGNISTTGGADSRVFTLASGLQGSNVNLGQIVMRAQDQATLALNILDTVGDVAAQSITVGQAVPEPATLGLFGLALAGCFGFVRRRIG